MSFLDHKSFPYIIAEAGVNHDGKLSEAFRMVDIAKESGADCIKFQGYSASELAVKSCEKPEYQKISGTKEENQYDMLLKYELKEDDFKKIKNYCQSKDIDFLLTPFSVNWVKRACNIGVDILKVSSGSVDALPLLEEMGKTNLPVILSTGMSNMKEISKAIATLKTFGCEKLALLHCVSLYPTKIEQINLFAMHILEREFNVRVGFSDHTPDINTGELAVAAGATILEKHFTINQKLPGPDHLLSLSPEDLKEYVRRSRRAAIICGEEKKEPLMEEFAVKKLVQTSLVTTRFIKKGEIIIKDMLTDKRPASGISPENINTVIGKKSIQDILEDEIIDYKYLEN